MDLDLGPRIIIRFDNGLFITETVFWAVIVAAAMIVFALISTRNLKRQPKGVQTVVEFIVDTVYNFTKSTMGERNLHFAPLVGTIFIFLLFCNALGLLGQRAPSSDLNFTFAMSLMVFFVIQGNSIRARRVKGYIKHLAEPNVLMFPMRVLEEVVFPVSLGFRLFGNILAGVIIMRLWDNFVTGASVSIFPGFFSNMGLYPLQAVTTLLPQAFFDIIEPVLQAFVFSMLTMIFLSRAVNVPGQVDDG